MEVGKVTSAIEYLTKKVNHNCEASTQGDKEILSKLDEVQKSFRAEIKEHKDYHKNNEETWGLQTWMRNNLRKTVIMVTIFVLICVSAFGITLPKILVWVRAVNGLVK